MTNSGAKRLLLCFDTVAPGLAADLPRAAFAGGVLGLVAFLTAVLRERLPRVGAIFQAFPFTAARHVFAALVTTSFYL